MVLCQNTKLIFKVMFTTGSYIEMYATGTHALYYKAYQFYSCKLQFMQFFHMCTTMYAKWSTGILNCMLIVHLYITMHRNCMHVY